MRTKFLKPKNRLRKKQLRGLQDARPPRPSGTKISELSGLIKPWGICQHSFRQNASLNYLSALEICLKWKRWLISYFADWWSFLSTISTITQPETPPRPPPQFEHQAELELWCWSSNSRPCWGQLWSVWIRMSSPGSCYESSTSWYRWWYIGTSFALANC